jgi:peroxiredoxin
MELLIHQKTYLCKSINRRKPMKKILSFTIIVLILASCGGRKANQFVIKGTVKGADTGMVFVQKSDGNTWIKLDSTAIKNGEFSFTGSVAAPEFWKLNISGMPFNYTFFAENADIGLVVHADSTEKIEVTGSATQDIYNKYNSWKDSIKQLEDGFDKEYEQAQKNGDSATMKKIDADYKVMDENSKIELKKFIRSNGKSVVSPYVTIRNAYRFELPDLEELATSMDTSLGKDTYYKAVQSRVSILRKVQIGQTAPDFTMNDTTGNPITLSSLKGKILLVDFWASWCGPCRRENPNVVKAYQAFHKKGFEILGVSLDRRKDKWEKAIQDDRLTWYHVSDLKHWGNEVAKLYGINSIPANVLLDKDQVIIARNIMGEDLMKKLTELLGAPVAEKKPHKK